ncbi:MAG: hypothetical protein R3B06_01980 [Kofleriaceae bacterium]
MVLDSPPLQALHRCGALTILSDAYAAVVVPHAIVEETDRSRIIEGAARVPDLADYPAIARQAVDDRSLASAGAVFVAPMRSTTEYLVGEHKIDRPELEVVLLARDLPAMAVVEDKAAIRVAEKLDVCVVGTAELLYDLELLGFLDDAVAAAQAIRATKYHTNDLQLLASGVRLKRWRDKF